MPHMYISTPHCRVKALHLLQSHITVTLSARRNGSTADLWLIEVLFSNKKCFSCIIHHLTLSKVRNKTFNH